MAEYAAEGIDMPLAMRDYFVLQAVLTPEQRADREAVEMVRAMAGSFSTSYGPGGELGQASASAQWGREERLEELAGLVAPVLIVGAEYDPAFPPVLLRKAAALVADSTYVEIPNASHVPLDPATGELILAAVLEFLRTH
jgi:pimeloyl-ACP methyl ester carboxylesterase